MMASYQLIILFTISVISVYALYPGEVPILPIPKVCPEVDPLNYTVHIAHETNCSKFYKCFNGDKYEMDCPLYRKNQLLHFNKLLQVCDYPRSAGCQRPNKYDDEILSKKNKIKDDYNENNYHDKIVIN